MMMIGVAYEELREPKMKRQEPCPEQRADKSLESQYDLVLFGFIQWQSKFVDPRHKVYTFKHILVHDFSHQGNKNCLQSKLARDRREDDGFVVCLMFPESTEAQGSSRNFRPHYCLFMRHFDSFTFKTHHSWKGRKGTRILSTSGFCQPFNSNNEPVQLVPWNHQSRSPHWL